MRVALSATLLAAAGGCGWLYDWVGGDFAGPPSDLDASISDGARRLVAEAFEGIDRDRLVDLHVHIAGLGTSGSGIWVNPDSYDFWNLIGSARHEVYMSAAGVTDEERADAQYVERLLDLIRSVEGHGRCFIYSLDRHHDPDGTPNDELTHFTVPNEYVVSLARKHADAFVPVISIHPYRSDAVTELGRWAGEGVRYVKWLPNAMGIDPSDERIEPFYRALVKHDMVLFSHTGRERAVDADRQHLGNPLLLRKPLEMGVTVVALHCAGDGLDSDLDDPAGRRIPSFDLFLRLMDDPKYVGRLYGDISATTFFSNTGRTLRTLLEREDLHARLINGSDYPVSAINVVIRPSELFRRGYITRDEWGYLNEIYDYNPLLFDFVVKRTIRHPATGRRFAASVFMLPPALER